MATAQAPTARQILSETGAPVIVFDHVHLAFDDNVVLDDVSFTLIKGHTKIILGASGSGKSTILKIVTGLLRGTLCLKQRIQGEPRGGRSDLRRMPLLGDAQRGPAQHPQIAIGRRRRRCDGRDRRTSAEGRGNG